MFNFKKKKWYEENGVIQRIRESFKQAVELNMIKDHEDLDQIVIYFFENFKKIHDLTSEGMLRLILMDILMGVIGKENKVLFLKLFKEIEEFIDSKKI